MPALPGTHYSWVGWSNVRKFLAQGNQPLVLPHIPQLYSWVDWSNVGKVLAQGNNNNKQHHLGIEPGSSGSQADPKPLHGAYLKSNRRIHGTLHTLPKLPPLFDGGD